MFEDIGIVEQTRSSPDGIPTLDLANGWKVRDFGIPDLYEIQDTPPAIRRAALNNTSSFSMWKLAADGQWRRFQLNYENGDTAFFPLVAVLAADGDPTPIIGNDNPDVPPDPVAVVVGRYDRSGITITEVVETQDQGLDIGNGWVAIAGTGEPFPFNGWLYTESGGVQLTIAKYATDGTLRTFHVAWPPDNVQGIPLTDPLGPLAIPFGAAVIEGGPQPAPEPFEPTAGLETPTGGSIAGPLIADQASDIPDSCCPFTFEDNEYEFTSIVVLVPDDNAHPTEIASKEEAVDKLTAVAENCGGNVVLFTVSNQSSASPGAFAEGTSYYAAVMIETGHCDGDPTSLDDCSYCDPLCPRYDPVACEITGGQVYPPGQGDSLELNALDLVPTPCGVRGDFDFDGICNSCDANNGDWVQLQTRDIAGSDVQVCFWYMDGYNNRDWVYHGGPQQVHSAIPLLHCLPICADEDNNGVCDTCEHASDTPGSDGYNAPGATHRPDEDYYGSADDTWQRLTDRLGFVFNFGAMETLCHPVRYTIPSYSSSFFGHGGAVSPPIVLDFDTCLSGNEFMTNARVLCRSVLSWFVSIYAFFCYFRFFQEL